MAQVLRGIFSVSAVAGALAILSADYACAQADEPDEFVPGEIVVGFSTQQDRESLVNQLSQTRERLRAGGENPAGLAVERTGGAALKLKIDFSDNIKARLRAAPGAELTLLEEVAQQIKTNNSAVTYAHPNWIMRVDPIEAPQGMPMGEQAQAANAMPNDPVYVAGMQWHYKALPGGMNAEAAWAAGITGSRDIIVGVLDTGQVFDHEDVRGSQNLTRGASMLTYNFCTKQKIDRAGDANDTGDACPEQKVNNSSWHGSHVSGVIGAAITNNRKGIAGINWSVTVVPVRVLGPLGGTSSDIADGIRWAAGLPVENARPIAKRVDVINMSLGGRGPCTQDAYGVVRQAIADARTAGTVVVVSAGNGSWFNKENKACEAGSQNCSHRQEDYKLYRPAACPGTISVAANGPTGTLAPYSNFGAVNIMAPGGDVSQGKEFNIFGQTRRLNLGVWSIIKDQYGSMNGTSQAAPHVTGAIALAMSKDPSLRGKPDEVERRLRASAVMVAPNACPRDKPCGPGQLDVMKLINQR